MNLVLRIWSLELIDHCIMGLVLQCQTLKNLCSCTKFHCYSMACIMGEKYWNPSVQRIKGLIENVTKRTYNELKVKIKDRLTRVNNLN